MAEILFYLWAIPALSVYLLLVFFDVKDDWDDGTKITKDLYLNIDYRILRKWEVRSVGDLLILLSLIALPILNIIILISLLSKVISEKVVKFLRWEFR